MRLDNGNDRYLFLWGRVTVDPSPLADVNVYIEPVEGTAQAQYFRAMKADPWWPAGQWYFTVEGGWTIKVRIRSRIPYT